MTNIEVRTHGTTLYNSIYRVDNDMLVNTHIWGVNAFSPPIWHLRQNTAEAMGLFAVAGVVPDSGFGCADLFTFCRLDMLGLGGSG
ncbi:hypothetical protein ACFV9C_09545 [Kribbella sp. NPDC059898]|uniref:hypothetical protein n=1 Tax=Kribbella sp. NPDC059898 TaxID=3346995 RepID=UPI00364B05B7